MGVYIDMEMPKSCMLCPFCVEEADPANGEMCMVTGKLMPPCTRVRLDSCPLVPVPDHGRLIDADALLKQLEDGSNQSIGQAHYTYSFASMYVMNAPTIIPADKEGEK